MMSSNYKEEEARILEAVEAFRTKKKMLQLLLWLGNLVSQLIDCDAELGECHHDQLVPRLLDP